MQTSDYGNKTARTVAIRQGETINAPALTAMFKQIMPTTGPAAGESSSASTERPPAVATAIRGHASGRARA